MSETTQQKLAAHFEECARMLRKHPELFGDKALEIIGSVSALSMTVCRAAARKRGLVAIMFQAADPLLQSLHRAAGTDRASLILLAKLRRGWIDGTALVAAHQIRVERVALGLTGPTITSHCPRCDARSTRDLYAPAPCSECGFEFEAIEATGG